MTKLIQSNPFKLGSASYKIWAAGFKAGQKSTLVTVSVTGRWWQSSNGRVLFAEAGEYDAVQRAADNNPKLCGWLTEEETREFT